MHRPAVADDMMHGISKEPFFVCKLVEAGSDEGSCGQVEGAEKVLLAEHSGFFFGIVLLTEVPVADLVVSQFGGKDELPDFPVGVFAEYGAKDLMAMNDLSIGVVEGVPVERAFEDIGIRHIISDTACIELAEEPHSQLRGG